MVYLSFSDLILANARTIAQELKDAGILVGAVGPRQFRLVTHYWIDDEAVNTTIRTFEEILSKHT